VTAQHKLTTRLGTRQRTLLADLERLFHWHASDRTSRVVNVIEPNLAGATAIARALVRAVDLAVDPPDPGTERKAAPAFGGNLLPGGRGGELLRVCARRVVGTLDSTRESDA
jgi:hypothetical protein